MTKKRKNIQDWDEDEEVTVKAAKLLDGNGDQFQVHLEDYVIPAKVSAFVRDYEPCNEGDPGYEQFDDGRLREVFKAYVCGLGDPLKLYIEDLKMASFRMDCSLATGEPCIFARRKIASPPSMDGSK